MLLNCILYEAGEKIASIDLKEIDNYSQIKSGFVWMAFKDATEAEIDHIQRSLSLHPLAIEDVKSGSQRPKLEEYGTVLFCVIHLLDLVDDEIVTGEVNMFVADHFVVSLRSNSQQDFLGVRARCEQESALLSQGTSFVFYAILDAVVDRYFLLLDYIESELEAIEISIFKENAGRKNIERLYNLKRKTLTLRHAAIPMMEFIGKLHGGRVPALCANSQEYFRDVHDHISRIVSVAEDVREAVTTAIQVNLAMLTIEETEITKKLASWASIFAASTAMAGIWGMNFEHMPELHWEFGYPLALVSIGFVSLSLYFRFKRVGWL
ncbi:MAG: magnesium and cobalt transport protein CorA [Betaproteobacteria bacterium]